MKKIVDWLSLFIKKFYGLVIYSTLATVLIFSVYVYLKYDDDKFFSIMISFTSSLISIVTLLILFYQFKNNNIQIDMQRKALEAQIEAFNYSKKAKFAVQVNRDNYGNNVLKVYNFGQSPAYGIKVQIFILNDNQYTMSDHKNDRADGLLESNNSFQIKFANPMNLNTKTEITYRDLSSPNDQLHVSYYPKKS